MNNLTTHMAELRNILAEIENKTITENLAKVLGDIGQQMFKDGVVGLAKQEAKFIIKQLGPDVTVPVMRKLAGKKEATQVELVLKKIPEKDSYQIVTVDGKPPSPKQIRQGQDIVSAEQVATDVEKAVAGGKTVKTSGELQIKASSETAQQAVKDAENMTDEQLEAAIKDMKRPPALRKEYQEILNKRKSSKTGDSESIKREAEMEAKRIARMSDAELQALYNNSSTTAVSRQAAKEELERRGIKPEATKPAEVKPDEVKPDEVKPAEVKPAEVKPAEVTPDGVTPNKTIDDVLQEKKIAAAKAETEASLNAGEITIRESDLLPAKVGETYTERVIRSLEQKPELADTWNKIKGTKGEEGFWGYVGKRKVASLLLALTVAGVAAGIYTSSSGEEDLTVGDNAASGETPGGSDASAADAKKKADADAAAADAEKKADADAAAADAEKKTDANQGANTITGDEAGGKEGGKESETADTLKSQIDALIAELSKSKDPAIQKRLAAVRAKLGQGNQGENRVTDSGTYEAGGWYNIGRGFRRWYGKDGVDPDTGRMVTTGTTDIIPIDDRQRDKFDNMSQSDLAAELRKAANAKNTAKTKSNWNNN